MDLTKFDRGVFLLNVLGIVFDPVKHKVLIGRRENDPHIRELTWCFPGGRPAYEQDLEHYLVHEIKIKTGIDAEIKSVIFAKTYPENRRFLAIYYLCQPISGQATTQPGEKFVETKWVSPNEIPEYFTTSLHPKLFELLKSL